MSAEVIQAEGVVVEHRRGDLFEVDAMVGGRTVRVLARPSGRLHTNRIRITVGDRVDLEISPYDVRRGRIVFRGARADGATKGR